MFSKRTDNIIEIEEALSYNEYLTLNKVLRRGMVDEISDFYCSSNFDRTSFWNKVSGTDFPREHSMIPSSTVSTLSKLVSQSFLGVNVEDEKIDEIVQKILTENNINDLIRKSTDDVMTLGDGVFKISFDTSYSNLPIIEFYNAFETEYIYKYNSIYEILFKKYIEHNNRKYCLIEVYGRGYIRYKLYYNEKEVALNLVPEFEDLKDIEFNDKIMLCVPYKVKESSLFLQRGASLYEEKYSSFSSLDEILSTYKDSIRNSKSRVYVPTELIPKDSNGNMIKPNSFLNNIIQIKGSFAEDKGPEIKIIEPNIQGDKYFQAYKLWLENSISGIISANSLGISDDKINNNSLAETEKEKITHITKQAYIDELVVCIKEILMKCIYLYNYQYKTSLNYNINIEVKFSSYSNSSFEKIVNTMSLGAPGKQIISYERIVDELYADTLTKEQKEEEVKRLKELNETNFDEIDLINNEDI